MPSRVLWTKSFISFLFLVYQLLATAERIHISGGSISEVDSLLNEESATHKHHSISTSKVTVHHSSTSSHHSSSAVAASHHHSTASNLESYDPDTDSASSTPSRTSDVESKPIAEETTTQELKTTTSEPEITREPETTREPEITTTEPEVTTRATTEVIDMKPQIREVEVKHKPRQRSSDVPMSGLLKNETEPEVIHDTTPAWTAGAECPCIRATGSSLCMKYDPHVQAATVEEAIANFFDPRMSSDHLTNKHQLNPGWNKHLMCSSEECLDCLTFLLHRFEDMAKAAEPEDKETLVEVQSLFRKHNLDPRKTSTCKRFLYLRYDGYPPGRSHTAPEPKVVEDMHVLTKLLRIIRGKDDVSVCPKDSKPVSSDSIEPHSSDNQNTETSPTQHVLQRSGFSPVSGHHAHIGHTASKSSSRSSTSSSSNSFGFEPVRIEGSGLSAGQSSWTPGTQRSASSANRNTAQQHWQQPASPRSSSSSTQRSSDGNALAHYRVHHRRTARNIEPIASKMNVDCRRKGTPIDSSMPHCGLCDSCWTISSLKSNYFPKFINHMTCGGSSSCLKGYGECRSRTRAFNVLQNYGTELSPTWQESTINVPMACDCQIRGDSALYNTVI